MVEARTLKLVAGLGAAAFLGYCIYFDKKRRSAPDFREKLKGNILTKYCLQSAKKFLTIISYLARRKRAAQETSKQSGLNLPDFQDQEAVQRFFLQEVQLGEELLGQGDIENGIEHLSMAVAVCGQPHSLLGVLVI